MAVAKLRIDAPNHEERFLQELYPASMRGFGFGAEGKISLEMEADGNLERARASRLVERPRWSEALIQHQRGLTEEGVGQRRIDVSKIRMVEKVIGLHSQLNIQVVFQVDLAPNGCIDLIVAESSKQVSGGIARRV